MSDIEPLLVEMRDGLSGVTPGPWFNRGRSGATKPIAVGAGPAGQSRFRLFSVYHPMGASSYETWANAEHLARCAPENIAAILAEIACLRSALSTAREAGRQEGMEAARKLAEDEYRKQASLYNGSEAPSHYYRAECAGELSDAIQSTEGEAAVTAPIRFQCLSCERRKQLGEHDRIKWHAELSGRADRLERSTRKLRELARREGGISTERGRQLLRIYRARLKEIAKLRTDAESAICTDRFDNALRVGRLDDAKEILRFYRRLGNTPSATVMEMRLDMARAEEKQP